MSIFFTLPLFLALILLIWLDSDAISEYGILFKINLPYIKEYRNMKEQGSPISYKDYLSIYHDTFFIRLISCEICLSVWLGLIFGFLLTILLFITYGLQGLLIAIIYSISLPYLILFAYRLIKKLH